MGLYYRDRLSSSVYDDEPLANPDPTNYKFMQVEERKGYLLVWMNYPDCTNYEGNKILLYEGITFVALVNQREIDPHFFVKKGMASPIARFIPTKQGWDMGIKLIDALKL